MHVRLLSHQGQFVTDEVSRSGFKFSQLEMSMSNGTLTLPRLLNLNLSELVLVTMLQAFKFRPSKKSI